MFKVLFMSHHFASTDIFLQSILKMTPNSSGKWKEMEATLDEKEADFFIAVDGVKTLNVPEKRTLYFNQHPKGVPAYKPLNDKPEALGVFPADTHLNLGEWWISYDYDALMALEPPKKTKDLISITTYHIEPNKPTYEHRIKFLEQYVKLSNNIDIYGRQEDRFRANSTFKDTYRGVAGFGVNCDYRKGEHIIGKDIEIDYRYALDFDHGRMGDGKPVTNYFSERFYDSMLLWTMPIYFGGDNVNKFLPEKSFVSIDISGTQEQVKEQVEFTNTIVNSHWREINIKAIKEARELLLNKYQTWAYVYDTIKGL